ncbi:hypothetical protein Tcan_00353 [Toxocara canis]|uniref:Uncharacterized protein n=1 Tax=Toxocara canis TaxID=6265 RepID=A0A0B2VZU2_TOXCA|nr:hypothetical protein Tcan_00353 [Toxocara canis]
MHTSLSSFRSVYLKVACFVREQFLLIPIYNYISVVISGRNMKDAEMNLSARSRFYIVSLVVGQITNGGLACLLSSAEIYFVSLGNITSYVVLVVRYHSFAHSLGCVVQYQFSHVTMLCTCDTSVKGLIIQV